MTLPPSFWPLLDRRVRQALASVARPIRGLLASVDASLHAPLARLDGRADETVDAVEMAQHFGFASVPPVATEVVAVPIGGSSAHLIIIGEIDRAMRPTDLAPGETCIYCAQLGTRIRLSADGTIELATLAGAPSLGVARLGDTCSPGPALAAWIASVSSATASLGVTPPVDTDILITTASTTVTAGG